jgi:DNA polymerase-4
MSEEAYRAGVRKGMALSQATRICREAELRPPRPELYRRAMDDFLRQVRSYSPRLEHGLEDGHVFVDLTGTHRLFGPAMDVGLRLRREVRRQLGFTPIWTLATSKLVAKVASRLVKPVGEYIVSAGEESDFLAPLPVALLPGLAPGELQRLGEFRILSVGQLAGLSRGQLLVPFGRRSDYLYDASRGIDTAPVLAGAGTAAVAVEQVFAGDTNDRQEVIAAVADLVSRAGMELRQRRQEARRVGVRIGYADGLQVVRSATARRRTASDFELRQLADQALARAWLRRGRLRSCRLVCDDLCRQSPQLSLFAEPSGRERRQTGLLAAMDAIRSRYGHALIATGRQRLSPSPAA